MTANELFSDCRNLGVSVAVPRKGVFEFSAPSGQEFAEAEARLQFERYKKELRNLLKVVEECAERKIRLFIRDESLYYKETRKGAMSDRLIEKVEEYTEALYVLFHRPVVGSRVNCPLGSGTLESIENGIARVITDLGVRVACPLDDVTW